LLRAFKKYWNGGPSATLVADDVLVLCTAAAPSLCARTTGDRLLRDGLCRQTALGARRHIRGRTCIWQCVPAVNLLTIRAVECAKGQHKLTTRGNHDAASSSSLLVKVETDLNTFSTTPHQILLHNQLHFTANLTLSMHQRASCCLMTYSFSYQDNPPVVLVCFTSAPHVYTCTQSYMYTIVHEHNPTCTQSFHHRQHSSLAFACVIHWNACPF